MTIYQRWFTAKIQPYAECSVTRKGKGFRGFVQSRENDTDKTAQSVSLQGVRLKLARQKGWEGFLYKW